MRCSSGIDGNTLLLDFDGVAPAAERLMRVSADPAWVPEGKGQLAAEGIRQLAAAEPGSDHQLAWAQLLGWTAAAPDQLDFVAGLLDGSICVPGLPVDTELRWSLLSRLAVACRAGDAEIDAELSRDATDAGRRHAAACKAAIGDAEHKAAAWQTLTESAGLGLEDAASVARAFNVPEHTALLRPYAEKYFEVLPQIWASRNELMRQMLGEALFPHPAASPQLLQRVDDFLGQPGLDPVLGRVVAEGRDVAGKALRARNLPASLGG